MFYVLNKRVTREGKKRRTRLDMVIHILWETWGLVVGHWGGVGKKLKMRNKKHKNARSRQIAVKYSSAKVVVRGKRGVGGRGREGNGKGEGTIHFRMLYQFLASPLLLRIPPTPCHFSPTPPYIHPTDAI